MQSTLNQTPSQTPHTTHKDQDVLRQFIHYIKTLFYEVIRKPPDRCISCRRAKNQNKSSMTAADWSVVDVCASRGLFQDQLILKKLENISLEFLDVGKRGRSCLVNNRRSGGCWSSWVNQLVSEFTGHPLTAYTLGHLM